MATHKQHALDALEKVKLTFGDEKTLQVNSDGEFVIAMAACAVAHTNLEVIDRLDRLIDILQKK